MKRYSIKYKCNTLHFVLFLGIILFFLNLSGCKRQIQNPLLMAPKQEAMQFIYQAEAYAAKKTGLTDTNKNIYSSCVINLNYLVGPYGKKGPSPCQEYFKAMAEYASTTKNFNEVTPEFLQDKAVLRRLNLS